jgi:hypothetical protein
MGVPVAVMVPVVVMTPGVYTPSAAGMVSLGVAPPVVQALEDAVAVQDAVSRARLSATVTGPMAPVMVVPGAPLPKLAEAGAVIVKAPTVTVKVTVVFGSPALGLLDEYASTVVPAVAADATAGARPTAVTAATARTLNVVLTICPPRKCRCLSTRWQLVFTSLLLVTTRTIAKPGTTVVLNVGRDYVLDVG